MCSAVIPRDPESVLTPGDTASVTPTLHDRAHRSLEVTVVGRPASHTVSDLHDWALHLPAPLAATLRYAWRLADGDRPRATSELTRRLIWRHPTTYRQKMLYKLSRDRRPLITTFADKVAVREYVAQTIGTEFLKRTYAVVPHGRLIPWQVVPRSYVCKVSHGCGGVVVVSPLADPATTLPTPADRPGWGRHFVHPDSVSRDAVADLCDYWLTLRYGRGPGQSLEWAYRNVPPRIVIEEFYQWRGGLPLEMWAHCFNGEVGSVMVLGRGPSFEEVDRVRTVADDIDLARKAIALDPTVFDHLLDKSRALAAPTDMVRVDWLITDQGPRFAELTNYPAAGKLTFLNNPTRSPSEVHDLVASYWTVPRRYT